MIEEGALVPFDDDKPLEDYTTKDFSELFEANFQKEKMQLEKILQKSFLILFQKNYKLQLNM
jgi:hypothetical protein